MAENTIAARFEPHSEYDGTLGALKITFVLVIATALLLAVERML